MPQIRYHADFNKRHEVSRGSSPQLQHHSCCGIQTKNVTKCPQMLSSLFFLIAAFYPKLKITLTFIPTLLLKIGSNCLNLKGHFVSDIKIGHASAFLDTSGNFSVHNSVL